MMPDAMAPTRPPLLERYPWLLPQTELGAYTAVGQRQLLVQRLVWWSRIRAEHLGWLLRAAGTGRLGRVILALLVHTAFWRGVREATPTPHAAALADGTAILMYHAVDPAGAPGSRYVIAADRLEAQLRTLLRAGHRPIRLAALLEHRARHEPAPARSFVVTIDDGYADIESTVLPVLRRLDVPATLFLVEGAVGSANGWDRAGAMAGRPLLDAAALDRLRDEPLLDLAAHSAQHRRLTDLPATELDAEVGQAAARLAARFGPLVPAFAYPFGAADDAARAAVVAAGMTGLGVREGLACPASPGGRAATHRGPGHRTPRCASCWPPVWAARAGWPAGDGSGAVDGRPIGAGHAGHPDPRAPGIAGGHAAVRCSRVTTSPTRSWSSTSPRPATARSSGWPRRRSRWSSATTMPTRSAIGRAWNLGARTAAYDRLLFLDDDVLVDRSWCATMRAALEAAGQGTVVSGRFELGDAEAPGAFAPSTTVRRTRATYRAPVDEDVLYTGNAALHRDTLVAVGGFDPRLGPGTRFPAAEDNDLAHRLLVAGVRIAFEPDAIVVHRAWRPPAERVPMRWRYGLGQGAFLAKHLRAAAGPTVGRSRRAVVHAGRRCTRSIRARRWADARADGAYLAGLLVGMAGWIALEWRPRWWPGRGARDVVGLDGGDDGLAEAPRR